MATTTGSSNTAGSPGINWFPLETNLLTDDDKIFDLMDGSTDDDAFADFGRYVAMMSRVYREGPALQVGRRMARRMAHDLGLDARGFEDFVGRCVDAGLLSRRLWEGEHVITSRGIQMRWIRAKARSKSQGLPAEFSRWSLLDADEDEDTWDDAAPEPSGTANADVETRSTPVKRHAREIDPLRTPENSPEFSKGAKSDEGESDALKSPENSPLDKIRLDKTREEKKREEDQSVRLSGGSEVFDNSADLVPACLAAEEDGKLFIDSAGGYHRTRWGALESTYRAKTSRGDFATLARKVADLCPGGCRASPADRAECFDLVSDAIERYDPGKGSCWALVRHVLANDRGGRDAEG